MTCQVHELRDIIRELEAKLKEASDSVVAAGMYETLTRENARLRADLAEARRPLEDLVKWAGPVEAPGHPEFEQGYRAAVADVKSFAVRRLSALDQQGEPTD